MILIHTRNDKAIEEKWESIPESRVRGRSRNLPNREPNRDGWTRARTTQSSTRQESSQRIWDSQRVQKFGKRDQENDIERDLHKEQEHQDHDQEYV